MSLKCWWIFGHNWNKWEYIDTERHMWYTNWTKQYVTTVFVDKYKRSCQDCGKVEYSSVKTGER